MNERQPALKPTEPATLVVAGLAAAAVAWLLISNFYQQFPPMIWPPVVVIAGIAVFAAVVAQNLWARIHQRGRPLTGLIAGIGRRGQPSPATEPVEPLAVARYAVLAKASSVAAAMFAGFYLGLLPWLLVESGRLSGAAADLPPTVGGLVASVALLVAGRWLERACRVPERAGDDPEREDDSGFRDPDSM